MSSIIISQNGKNAKRINHSTFDLESNLQSYIFENPTVIPIDEIEDGLHLFVAAREFQVACGRIDALGFDQKGNIYVIETKLSRNHDKRNIIAQVFDYGAALWSNSSTAEFFDQLSTHTTATFGKDFHTAIAEYFQINDTDAIINKILENLSDGYIRFIVVMDEIETDLKNLVRFINQNSKYDLYAVELDLYKNADEEILIPHLYGDEIKKEVSTSNKSKNDWTISDEPTFMRSIALRSSNAELKESTLKLLSIFRNVVQHTTNDGQYFQSERLNLLRYMAHVFFLDDDSRISIFINSKEYADSQLANFFRQVIHRIREQGIFDIADPNQQRTIWITPSRYSVTDYRNFAQVCEQVAREQGFLDLYTEDNFRNFVNSFDWTFAKTYAQTAPHEYIIIKPDHPRRAEYLAALKFLFNNGIRENFHQQSYVRYILDGHKYWSMEQSLDDVDDETIVLNRTQPEYTYVVYE